MAELCAGQQTGSITAFISSTTTDFSPIYFSVCENKIERRGEEGKWERGRE
jgi:hypothetical protein